MLQTSLHRTANELRKRRPKGEIKNVEYTDDKMNEQITQEYQQQQQNKNYERKAHV